LTSEWEAYRWGPVSTRDPASGLLDDEGYFHRRSEMVQAQADAEAVQRELAAQVEHAIRAGIDVTHLDTHMGTVAHPQFVAGYVQLALQHRVPLLMMRWDEAGWRELSLDAEMAALAAGLAKQLEAQGLPLLDAVTGLPLEEHPEDRVAAAMRAFHALEPGLTHFIIHPACDTPELRAITRSWRSRVADYRVFTSERLRQQMRCAGVQTIGYRELRDLMRSAGQGGRAHGRLQRIRGGRR
jgi:predicted glycoside hydrolase/deacetylase ChbG (UPF0249 family)